MELEKKYYDASYIVEDIWCNMDWDGMNPSRKRGIVDELTGKLKAYARGTSSLGEFITKMCNSFNSRLRTEALLVVDDEEEILDIFREETQIPVLLMQIRRDKEKEAKNK